MFTAQPAVPQSLTLRRLDHIRESQLQEHIEWPCRAGYLDFVKPLQGILVSLSWPVIES